MERPITVLRMTGEQHERLRHHLFREDGCESVALALCGTRFGVDRQIYSIHEIFEIPSEACSIRSPTTVRWPVEMAMDLFSKAIKREMAILKIHSHPTGFDHFSKFDDDSDTALLGAFSSHLADPPRESLTYILS